MPHGGCKCERQRLGFQSQSDGRWKAETGFCNPVRWKVEGRDWVSNSVTH